MGRVELLSILEGVCLFKSRYQEGRQKRLFPLPPLPRCPDLVWKHRAGAVRNECKKRRVSIPEARESWSASCTRRRSMTEASADDPVLLEVPLPLGPPPPAGALFRCGCCQETLYESQLEYHASFCMPPEMRSSPQASPYPAMPADESQAQIDLANSPQMRRSHSEGPQPMWRRWEDSEIQIHHAKAEERISRRRQELLEEMKRREEEQCTFTPRLIARSGSREGTPRTRSDGLQDWLGQQLESKKKKVECLEEEMYGDFTYQPQITNMARQLPRQPFSSVFERLYKVAQERLRAKAAQPRSRSQENFRPSRRTDVHEHLYAQGLQQRARQSAQAEQANAEQRGSQVLSRSRQYYWHMLERQIREAFDKSTDDGNRLAYTALEDFLRHFGVVKDQTASTPLATERLKEESRRLRMTLWRHLDPEQVGFVDFLTLTVFFHVLMGAVDEEAQRLHNLAQQERASKGSPQATPGGSVSEELAVATAAARDAAAAADPEGTRICELLMRFNPKQLRTEFKQLYLDRLHQTRAQRQAEPEKTPSPSLTSHSRRLAQQFRQKLTEAGAVGDRHVDLLLWQKNQVEASRQRLREQRDAEEVEQCTFQPCLVSRRSRSAERPSRQLGQRLYERANLEQQRREASAAAREQARLDQEMLDCTFRPNLKKSDKSFASKTCCSPRGADASAQRLRKAFAENYSKRRLLEERCSQFVTAKARPEGTLDSPYARNGSESLGKRHYSTMVQAASPVSPLCTKQSQVLVDGAPQADPGGSGTSSTCIEPPRSSVRRQKLPGQPKQQAQRAKAKAGRSLSAVGNREADCSVEKEIRPILIAEVSVSRDIPPQKLVLYEADDVAEVAADFAAQHQLPAHMKERLQRYLSELRKRNEGNVTKGV